MKTVKALTLVLALILLVAPILVAKPGFSANPVSISAQPVAVAPLTDIDVSANTLETPNAPSPVGKFFDVEIHILGATVANVPAGVGGVEVHLDFSGILTNAVNVSFTNMINQVGGVALTAPLYGINPNFYGNEFALAAAGTGAAWNGADGLIAIVRFQITTQPQQLLSQPDFIGSITLVGATGAVDGAASTINLDLTPGTLHIDSALPVLPVPPTVFITPPTFTGIAPIGTLFNYTVMITADSFWDVAGFDITVNWNNSLINLVAYAENGFLEQGGAGTFGFFTPSAGSLNAVFTKLTDVTPSSGTDILLELEFSVAFVGNSFPAQSCAITITPIDLVSWAHPERIFAPWSSSITAVSLFPFPGATITDATYIAPIQLLGANIDLYDQYPDPFGGQGPNQHSDSFAPQAEVCLYAKVTFGGDRVTNKLVSFEIHNALGQKITILQNYSDINGIAKVCFRIPQTDLIPGGEDPAIFGWWYVNATVEVDQMIFNDTMYYQVGWLAQITSVTANNSPYHKYTDVMNFTASLTTIHEQPIYVLVSIDSYDVMGYPLGESAQYMYVNATRSTCPFTGPLTTTTGGVYPLGPYIQGIPTWARVGTASVIGYALTDYPRLGGTPYGPQSPTTNFGIIYP